MQTIADRVAMRQRRVGRAGPGRRSGEAGVNATKMAASAPAFGPVVKVAGGEPVRGAVLPLDVLRQ